MLRNAIWMTFFGLLIGGCASDGTGAGSSTVGEGAVMSTPAPAVSTPAPAEAVSTPTISGAAASESTSMNRSRASKSRMAAEVEEETLNTCVARIPQNATVGQRMLAEQTCRRDYAGQR